MHCICNFVKFTLQLNSVMSGFKVLYKYNKHFKVFHQNMAVMEKNCSKKQHWESC